MEYRLFGKTGKKISVLGFGAMRLPEIKKDGIPHVDEEKSIKLILEAFNHGINYIDTAYPYSYGESEVVLGKALKEWKGRVYVSTKSPVWRLKKAKDYRQYLEESLKKMDLACIDFYHFHSLNNHFYKEKILKLKLIDEAIKAKDQGLINHISFSFHDHPDVLKEIIDAGVFESVLCQYNFLDRTNEEAIGYASSRGVGVAVMGPVAGGRMLNKGIEKLIGEKQKDIVELALKFVFLNKNISTALSGMSNLKMLKENTAIANGSYKLTEKQKKILEKILYSKEIKEMIPCNDCGYCIPCPNDIPIPRIFKLLNYYILTGIHGNTAWQYSLIGRYDDNNKADECTECGQCEEKCPQKITIIEELKRAHKALN